MHWKGCGVLTDNFGLQLNSKVQMYGELVAVNSVVKKVIFIKLE